MRSGVVGVIVGAAAIVVAAWYLGRTRDNLLPTSLSQLSLTGGAPGGCGCGCGGSSSGIIAPGGQTVGQAPGAVTAPGNPTGAY